MDHVWWRSHLRKLTELGIMAQFGTYGDVDRQMPFLTGALDLPTGGRVLELGCGRGTYSIRLAQWGYQVTGIDESEPMLAVAREAARQRETEVDFRVSDLWSLPERSAFDGALILDYGTLSDADNAAVMRTVAAALKPGSKVVFGTCNPYFWAREPFVEHRLVEGMDVIQRYRFDFSTGSVVSRIRIILPNGERKAVPEAHYRAYSLPELKALTAATGLADLKVYGQDEGGTPRADRAADPLRTPTFHCVAVKPVIGESGEGI